MTEFADSLHKMDIIESLYDSEGDDIQSLAKRVARPGMMVCEVGSWKGHSTAFLAQVVQEYTGLIYAVDTWEGSIGFTDTIHIDVNSKDILRLFQSNMQALGFSCVRPLVMKSLDAAAIVKNELFDMIFLDADHSYEQIKLDVRAWLPAVKYGGIISGHDCEYKYSEQTDDVRKVIDIEAAIVGKQFTKGIGIHCGVIKALYEIFNDKHTIFPNGSRIWYWEKQKES